MSNTAAARTLGPPLCEKCGARVSRREYRHCLACSGLAPLGRTDPEQRAVNLARYHRLYASDPEFKKKRKEQRFLRYRTEPEWREKQLVSSREFSRKKQFDISSAEVSELLCLQEGACAICYRNTANPKRPWVVDHDHGVEYPKGEKWRGIRGILCSGCNVWLGSQGDSIERLAARNHLIIEAVTKYFRVTVTETQRHLVAIKSRAKTS